MAGAARLVAIRFVSWHYVPATTCTKRREGMISVDLRKRGRVHCILSRAKL